MKPETRDLCLGVKLVEEFAGAREEAASDLKARLTVAAANQQDVGLSLTLGELFTAAEEGS